MGANGAAAVVSGIGGLKRPGQICTLFWARSFLTVEFYNKAFL